MKAMLYTQFGTPDVLRLQDVPKPVPQADEVLVKIRATSLNFGDKALVSGKPFLVRLMGYGLFKPKYSILGTDIAGEVEAVGSGVKQFQPGDEVFAEIEEAGFGAFAEYVVVPASMLVLKPANLSFEQAASIPQAAVVALQGLRDPGQLRSGEKVLVIGASGGIGTFAVQIAKAFGAEVTGVCSTKNVELVRSLGADRVIDYSQEDPLHDGTRYDLIFDIVANHPISDYLDALNPKGRYVACAFNAASLFMGPILSMRSGKKVSSLVHKPDIKDLEFLRELLEAGKVIPVIDRCYPLEEIPGAMRYLGTGSHTGKIVISMKEN